MRTSRVQVLAFSSVVACAGPTAAADDGGKRSVALKIYPEVGHNLHWEIPKPVAEDLAAFLN
jgi:pimeloyl-ACP methyl ester carboxylesterase